MRKIKNMSYFSHMGTYVKPFPGGHPIRWRIELNWGPINGSPNTYKFFYQGKPDRLIAKKVYNIVAKIALSQNQHGEYTLEGILRINEFDKGSSFAQCVRHLPVHFDAVLSGQCWEQTNRSVPTNKALLYKYFLKNPLWVMSWMFQPVYKKRVRLPNGKKAIILSHDKLLKTEQLVAFKEWVRGSGVTK